MREIFRVGTQRGSHRGHATNACYYTYHCLRYRVGDSPTDFATVYRRVDHHFIAHFATANGTGTPTTPSLITATDGHGSRGPPTTAGGLKHCRLKLLLYEYMTLNFDNFFLPYF